ncbi:YafY family protein [Deferribacterales bacterium RsTz2092]|nr:DNA-binding transcriptional regulator [Deferribacterales bacterium]
MAQERAQYDRVYEIMSLINRLCASMDGLGYDEIMQEFGWERRTAERVIELVANLYPTAFIRRVEDRKAYFRLERQRVFPPNYITEGELSAINAAVKMLKSKGELSETLKTLYNKLTSFSDYSRKLENNIEQLTLMNGVANSPAPHIKLNREIVGKLQEAVLSFHQIAIGYLHSDGTVKKSTLCPLGFLYGKLGYLVATSKGGGSPRLYKLHHIKNVKVLPDSFDAGNFDINEYAKNSFGVFQDGMKYKVKWRVDADVAGDARLFEFHPSQKITENKDDGSLLVEFEAEGLLEMCYHLFTWQGTIHILEPQELKALYNTVMQNLPKALY